MNSYARRVVPILPADSAISSQKTEADGPRSRQWSSPKWLWRRVQIHGANAP